MRGKSASQRMLPHPDPLLKGEGEEALLQRICCIASPLRLLVAGAAYGLYLKAFADAGPLPLEEAKATIRHRRRSRRSPAARLHDDGRQMAAAARAERCRSALPQDAVRLRGQALLQPPRHRSESRCCAPSCKWCATARIVSGGSTLTMQVARLLDGKHERTAGGKLRQMARAHRTRASACRKLKF